MIDFTNCKVLKKSYNGANGSKICIEYNNEKYMLKFPNIANKNNDMSYANGCISEYISCNVYDKLNIPVQKTLLGYYRKNGKEKIVVACKDFTFPNMILLDFCSIKNQIIDSKNNVYGTELNSILETIEKQMNIDSEIVMQRFWDMFIVDSLLGNFDRHNGNWGFLYNQELDEMSLAPVYDCGSCLYPQADINMINKIMNDENELKTRIYNRPLSAIKENNVKLSYPVFLKETKNKDCINSLISIYERINLDDFFSIVDSIDCIEDIQKDFYKLMLKERYDLILTPAYKKQKSLLIEVEENYEI